MKGVDSWVGSAWDHILENVVGMYADSGQSSQEGAKFLAKAMGWDHQK